MKKILNALLITLNVVLFGLAFYFVASRGVAPSAGWSSVELVTVVLTALAVLLTTLGIFIAVLAVWGYTRLSDDARAVATATARDVAAATAKEAAIDTTGKIVPEQVAKEVQRQIGEGSAYGAAAAEQGASDDDAP